MRRFWISDFGFGIGHRVGFKAKGARSILTSRFPPSTERKSAFTLIELMGVMAIIGILAAVMLPSMITRIEDANTTKEDANLEEIARALVAGIKATGTIPNPTTPNFTAGSWTAIALNYTTLGQTALASVLPANNDRQIILSANLAAYVTVNGNSYATDPDGWPNPLPNDLKIYILASSKNGLPLQAGIPVADIANWTKVFNAGTGTVAVPASVFGAANTTKGEFLHVKVVDLNQLFCRVELTDFASPINATVTTAGGGLTGYTLGNVVGTQSGYSFSFATSVGPPREIFIGDLGILVSASKQMVVRPGPPLAANVSDSPLPNPIAQFTINMPQPPWWEISSPTILGGQQMPNNVNTQTFYLIKGTSLSLYASGVVLPPTPILTVQINADSAFEYFNGSWTRVD
jgi:prepilin-type N-terminal cleavage/methylation domain-containing protein